MKTRMFCSATSTGTGWADATVGQEVDVDGTAATSFDTTGFIATTVDAATCASRARSCHVSPSAALAKSRELDRSSTPLRLSDCKPDCRYRVPLFGTAYGYGSLASISDFANPCGTTSSLKVTRTVTVGQTDVDSTIAYTVQNTGASTIFHVRPHRVLPAHTAEPQRDLGAIPPTPRLLLCLSLAPLNDLSISRPPPPPAVYALRLMRGWMIVDENHIEGANVKHYYMDQYVGNVASWTPGTSLSGKAYIDIPNAFVPGIPGDTVKAQAGGHMVFLGGPGIQA
eukprot:3310307-Prymnesium_polylepis.1